MRFRCTGTEVTLRKENQLNSARFRLHNLQRGLSGHCTMEMSMRAVMPMDTLEETARNYPEWR